MNRHTHSQKSIAVFGALVLLLLGAPRAAAAESTQHRVTLFNGHDLEGWDTLLGRAQPDAAPLGRNHDPLGVFTVVQVDSAPAIRISGQLTGALVSRAEFDNYHLHVQFKWGTLRWPPREHAARDSGILYHGVGEPDPHTGWLRSFECQIEEHDCGDFWSVRGASAEVETRRMDSTAELRRTFEIWCGRNEGHYAPFAYWPGGTLQRIDKDGLMKSVDAEKPTGQWNDVDIYCSADQSRHVINGVTNMVLLALSQSDAQGRLIPLTRGRIQLQSEGAEIFFRQIFLEPLGP